MLIKIIHMTAGVLVVLLFYTQAIMLLLRRRSEAAFHTHGVVPIMGLAKKLKIALHICWTVLILAGLSLLVNLPGVYPYWVFAKIGVFVLAILFSVLSFREKGSTRAQNIGLIGATICYALIVFLVSFKPWGYVMTGGANQPVAGSANASLAQAD